MKWINLTPDDLGEVNAIADLAHPGLPERSEVFEDKVKYFPAGCFKLLKGGKILGYGISHPWILDDVPPLNRFLVRPERPDCLYIHDIVVVPEARGRGASGELIGILRECADERLFRYLALTAVYGAERIWRKHGFSGSSVVPGYTTDAIYMVRPVVS